MYPISSSACAAARLPTTPMPTTSTGPESASGPASGVAAYGAGPAIGSSRPRRSPWKAHVRLWLSVSGATPSLTAILSPDPAPETERALLEGDKGAGAARCPVCGAVLSGRRRACSNRCRAEHSRRERARARAEWILAWEVRAYQALHLT